MCREHIKIIIIFIFNIHIYIISVKKEIIYVVVFGCVIYCVTTKMGQRVYLFYLAALLLGFEIVFLSCVVLCASLGVSLQLSEETPSQTE